MKRKLCGYFMLQLTRLYMWKSGHSQEKGTSGKKTDFLLIAARILYTIYIYIYIYAMVTVVGDGHGDTSSNPGRDWLHFT